MEYFFYLHKIAKKGKPSLNRSDLFSGTHEIQSNKTLKGHLLSREMKNKSAYIWLNIAICKHFFYLFKYGFAPFLPLIEFFKK